MKHKIPILISALFLMLSMASFEQVLACSCSSPTICQAYNFADYIFIGKIVRNENDILTFEVEEGFVGIKKGEQIKTIQGNDAGNCTFKV